MIPVNTNLWIEPPAPDASEPSRRACSLLIPVELDAERDLLINGLTGAIDLATRGESLSCFGDRGAPQAGHELARSLVARGHWIGPAAEERLEAELIRRIEAAGREEPMFFFLCPTNFCPMGCAYCVEGSAPRAAGRRAMSEDMVRQAFRAMEELSRRFDRALGHVLLFGGEPLQLYCLETIRAILAQARRRRIEMFVFTSGLDLPTYATLLSEYLDVVSGVSVTLDGSESHHNARRALPGAFGRAVSGIQRLSQAGVPVQIRTNVGRGGVDQVRWLRHFYETRGWWDNPRFSFDLAPLTNHGCRPALDGETVTHFETASLFYRLLGENASYRRFRFMGMFSYLYYVVRELGLIEFHDDELGSHVAVPRIHGCPANTGTTFTLVSDGSLHLCNEQAGGADVPVGSFWPELRLDEQRIACWTSRTVATLPECRACPYRFFCGGGCSLSSARRYGGDVGHGTCDSLRADFQRFFPSVATDITSRWPVPECALGSAGRSRGSRP
jgi:uncharacterized protein